MSDTEADFQKFTKDWVERLEPLTPVETNVDSQLEPVSDIKAVLFDVYGTLLISQSGDVDITQFNKKEIAAALPGVELACDVQDLIDRFVAVIRDHHHRSSYPHPEVDIIEVWRDVVADLKKRGSIRVSADLDYRRLAFAFELVNNAVWPMPGLIETLETLTKAGLELGIVSNAQFFTPVLLEYFLRGWWPFEKDLTVYSYRLMRAKPDPFLYRTAAEGLAARGIETAQTLYVGNDMLNDIFASHQVGYRTVLFAGDRRSLRMRVDRGELVGQVADRVITSLWDMTAILGL